MMLPGQSWGPLVAIIGATLIRRGGDGKFRVLDRCSGYPLAVEASQAQAMAFARQVAGLETTSPPNAA